ncbi:hypothetical protein F2P81_013821 [Scophthalmus maximus]|uniref:Uncharacterized protein n=1 Tax=Scophthalmus maximus TaxID=52904 RepID=A0A6A4SMH9_SCOMX|nr:hypothetical protein F2P81_013821 [Scophthalmus maximus]
MPSDPTINIDVSACHKRSHSLSGHEKEERAPGETQVELSHTCFGTREFDLFALFSSVSERLQRLTYGGDRSIWSTSPSESNIFGKTKTNAKVCNPAPQRGKSESPGAVADGLLLPLHWSSETDLRQTQSLCILFCLCRVKNVLKITWAVCIVTACVTVSAMRPG